MSIISIDGQKIRTLREEQELTQLYLATVVGVTTDTISRWENRRYPTIKLENAQKLAAALNVEVEDLLDAVAQPEDNAAVPGIDTLSMVDMDQDITPTASSGRNPKKLFLFGILGILAAVAVTAMSFTVLIRPVATVTATRILPAQAAPNVPFPVLIELHADAKLNVPVLIREQLIGEVNATGSGPEGSGKPFAKQPRWIGKLEHGHASFLYLVWPDKRVAEGRIAFSGDLVVQREDGRAIAIEGPASIELTTFHWSDVDRDNQISDGEILQAFEVYSRSGDPSVNLRQLEELWLSGGYEWDPETFSFHGTAPAIQDSMEEK